MTPKAFCTLALTLAGGLGTAHAIAVPATAPPSGEVGTVYCTSGDNSTGRPAEISASGSTSIADNDLLLRVEGMPVGEFFVFVHGPTPIQAPFGNGFLCVSGHSIIERPRLSIAGIVELPVDMNENGIFVGTHNFQCWFRDRTAEGMQHDASNAIAIEFQP
ncbi:MAG: hypothetical protein GY711_27455 [bacterium]|nr:hypothetical protein [bacterium]